MDPESLSGVQKSLCHGTHLYPRPKVSLLLRSILDPGRPLLRPSEMSSTLIPSCGSLPPSGSRISYG